MVYCISDLHGDYFKYRALLENLSFQSRDTLYVLGDVIDRGAGRGPAPPGHDGPAQCGAHSGQP